MTIQLLENKINKLSKDLEKIKKDIADLKQNPDKITPETNPESKSISIGFQLPGKPLEKINYSNNITLGELITDLDLKDKYRTVNGDEVAENYVLQNGDIVESGSDPKNPSRRPDFNEWKKLVHEVSKSWIGKADAVEEIRYQRSKNG